METSKCQVCKKNDAHRRVVSNLDDSFFPVCRKRKCINQLYEMVQPPTELEDFIAEVRWDESEHQGRRYDQMKATYKILDIVSYCFMLFCIGVIVYYVIQIF
jgi:hypothetical protein